MCQTHERERRQRVDRDRKDTAYRAIYQTKAWAVLRKMVLAEEPMCRDCGHEWANEVDHIKPMSLGGAPFDRANLQGLCKTCHSRKTMNEVNAAIRQAAYELIR